MPSIAIVGASSNRRKYGNRAVRAYLQQGFTVYPVHPSETEIEGLPVYRSVRDIPADILDRVTLYLGAEQGLQVLPDIASKQVGELLLNPGAYDPAVVARARELGLPVVVACSILAVGMTPSQLD